MHNNDEIMALVKVILDNLKPSLPIRILFTLILIGPIGKLILDTMQGHYSSAIYIILATLCIIIIISLWVQYVIAKEKYQKYKEDKIKEFQRLTKDHD